MKNTSFQLILVLLCTLVTSCQKDFEEINIDPSRSQTASPGSLLTPAITNLGWVQMRASHRLNNELMQYTVQTNVVNEFHRYIIPRSESSTIWIDSYAGLQNLNDLYSIAKERDEKNYMGIALVLKSLTFSFLTDCFGDIPYSNALKGEESNLFQPSFDEQKDVFAGILKDLETANSLFDPSQKLSDGGDFLYDGNILKWKKFSNSLRLRILTRASKKQEVNAQAKIKEIFDNPLKYPIFNSNADAAIIKYKGVLPYVNPFSQMRDTDFKANRGIANSFLSKLNTFNDPRRTAWATQTPKKEYVGLPSGMSVAQTTVLNYSALPSTLKKVDMPGIIMHYSEVKFLLAEAALNGWITSDPKTQYEEAIMASMAFWKVTMPANYLTQPGGSYDNKLETIITQKWISNFFSGLESWFEYRRTGFPVLPIGTATQNNGILPRRLVYPAESQTLNNVNYKQAVERLGKDDLLTNIWWAK